MLQNLGGVRSSQNHAVLSVIDEHGMPSDGFFLLLLFSQNVLRFLACAATFLSMQMRSFVPTTRKPPTEQCDNSCYKGVGGGRGACCLRRTAVHNA